MAKTNTYTCIGSVRGSCDHKHRTLTGAIRCLEADIDGCAKQGGYSDRYIRYSDGRLLSDDDCEHVDYLLESV